MASIKTKRAGNLTRDETTTLMAWCDCQTESLWDGMSLQEILNVYHATSEWTSFEAWAEEDWRAAYKAWNRAIIAPGNKMQPRAA
jgi:hypothetical protein